MRPVDTGAEQDVFNVRECISLVLRTVDPVGDREGDVCARRHAAAGGTGDLPHCLVDGLPARSRGGGAAVSHAGHVVVRGDGRHSGRRSAVQLEPHITVIRSFTVSRSIVEVARGAGEGRNTGRRCLDHRVAEDVGVVA